MPRAERRQREVERTATAREAADARRCIASACRRRFVHDVDDTDERRRAVCHRRRTPEHFDSLDVTHIERRQVRIECAAPGDVVDDEQEGVEFAKAPELRHGAGGPRITAGGDFHTGGERQRLAQVGGSDCPNHVAVDHFDRDRHVVRRLGDTGRDDLDLLLDGQWRDRRRLRRLCRGRSGRQRAADREQQEQQRTLPCRIGSTGMPPRRTRQMREGEKSHTS